MTAVLEGGKWSAARPGRTSPPGKIRYPFYRRLSGPQGRSGRAENLVPIGIRSRTVKPVVSRYTDWATWSTNLIHTHTHIYTYIYIYFNIRSSTTQFIEYLFINIFCFARLYTKCNLTKAQMGRITKILKYGVYNFILPSTIELH